MGILDILYWADSTPKPLGLFHIISILLVAIWGVLLCVFARNVNDKQFRRINLVMWIIFLVIETYKQLFMAGFSLEHGRLVWNYQWYLFPFQFCSSPFFVLPIVIFAKEKSTIRKMAISFMMTFSLFGGLCSYIFPSGVYCSRVLMNFQTMLHHGMQIVLGIYYAVRFKDELSLKHFLGGLILLGCFIAVALVLDELIFYTILPEGQVFNMFFISRHFECTQPIIGTVYHNAHYLVFLLVYIVGFALVGMIIYGIETLLTKLIKNKKAL